jgi:hypothetical protein
LFIGVCCEAAKIDKSCNLGIGVIPLLKLFVMAKAPVNNTPFKDKERAEAFRIERKMILSGKAMFKSDGKPQLVIYPHEVAIILKMSLRFAQRAIKKIRQENGKPGSTRAVCIYVARVYFG